MAAATAFDAYIFDLDGVVRHFDRMEEAAIERRHGLAPGSMIHAAFGSELGNEFICGRIDHPEFEARLATVIGPGAAAELLAMRPEVDHEVVSLIEALRADAPVALLTNGSTRTAHELAAAGLSAAFDMVVNSATLGIAKPAVEIYRHATGRLGVPPERTLFVDDRPLNIDGARTAGLVAHHFVGLDELRRFLGRAAP